MVDAETRLRDVQSLLRRTALKKRDAGDPRLVLLVRGSRANRLALREAADELGLAFPMGTRAALAALGQGLAPSADALVML